MPLYLLDANVLIRAHEDYYGLDQVPQFWDWLLVVGKAGLVKMPFEIHDEIAIATGPLAAWVKTNEAKAALVFEEEPNQGIVTDVITNGYAPDLSDSEIEKIGRDPFLVAYALAETGRIVVTKEVSKPSKQRANRKVPDVCNGFGVGWMTDFDFFKAVGFKAK